MSLHWHTEPVLLLLLLGSLWAYLLAVGPFRHRWQARGGDQDGAATAAPGATAGWPWARALAFGGGLAVVYLAVGSPLDALGERFLLSAHMVQHLLLVYVAPPLLWLGLPTALVDRMLLGWAPLRSGWGGLVHPVVAGASFTLILSLWHLPVLYEAALRDKTVHVFEHATMFGSALLLWWPLCGPSRLLPPSRPGVRMIFLLLLLVGQTPVFGLLTLTDVVLYPTYAYAPRLAFFPLSPLDDQILAGILMMVANVGVFLLCFGLAFFDWYRSSQAADRLPAKTTDAAIASP